MNPEHIKQVAEIIASREDTLSACHWIEGKTHVWQIWTYYQNPDEWAPHFPDWETLPYDHFSPHQDAVEHLCNTPLDVQVSIELGELNDRELNVLRPQLHKIPAIHDARWRFILNRLGAGVCLIIRPL